MNISNKSAPSSVKLLIPECFSLLLNHYLCDWEDNLFSTHIFHDTSTICRNSTKRLSVFETLSDNHHEKLKYYSRFVCPIIVHNCSLCCLLLLLFILVDVAVFVVPLYPIPIKYTLVVVFVFYFCSSTSKIWD